MTKQMTPSVLKETYKNLLKTQYALLTPDRNETKESFKQTTEKYWELHEELQELDNIYFAKTEKELWTNLA